MAPALIPPKMLNDLHALLEYAERGPQIKTQKTSRDSTGECRSCVEQPTQAVALWLEAVRTTQFEGAARESTQFMAWKNSEGEAFKDHEIQNALHLYFTWLSLTLQRSAGAKVKDLLPAVINYTKELSADKLAIEALEDVLKKEKEMNAGKAPARGPKPKAAADLATSRATHDNILNRHLAGQRLRAMDES